MWYDYKKIGARIKEERLEAGFKNQSDFAEKLCLSVDSRQTISKWENGHDLPSIDILLDMCGIFQCELGYLLCEYDCKNRNIYRDRRYLVFFRGRHFLRYLSGEKSGKAQSD